VSKRFSALVLALAALLLVSAAPAGADTTVTAQLDQANDSGVTGTATLTATDSGGLRVVIQGEGYVPGVPHAQHIHGATSGGHFMCPSIENDTDGDGLLTNEEAAGEYGQVFMALTTEGDASAESGLALDRMPVADSSGRIDYDRTFSADELPDGLVDQRGCRRLHVRREPRRARRAGGGDGSRQLWRGDWRDGTHGARGWRGDGWRRCCPARRRRARPGPRSAPAARIDCALPQLETRPR
jgi:hypothetical protein